MHYSSNLNEIIQSADLGFNRTLRTVWSDNHLLSVLRDLAEFCLDFAYSTRWWINYQDTSKHTMYKVAFFGISYDNWMRSKAFCINADYQLSFLIKIYIRQGRIRPNSAEFCRNLCRCCTYVFCIQSKPSWVLSFSVCNSTSRLVHYISK